ncbi:MAG TPA: hypothetical protein VHO90_19990, partial [Bacteroidales bacterium]|nr:hypothetical protein [Bacteroidales bacterium]
NSFIVSCCRNYRILHIKAFVERRAIQRRMRYFGYITTTGKRVYISLRSMGCIWKALNFWSIARGCDAIAAIPVPWLTRL